MGQSKRGLRTVGQGSRRTAMIYSLKSFFPTLYIGRVFVRTVLEICLLVLLVEGLYLSERFISILKTIIDQPVGLANAVPLLIWTAPEVQLALPLAVLIATYRVVLQYRENREFIAFASGGQGPSAFLIFAGLIGLSTLLCSMLISGEITPHAKFAFREKLNAVRYEALLAGSSPGQFLYFPDYTIYVWPTDGAAGRPIFVKQTRDDKSYRIMNAKQAGIIDESANGYLVIGVRGVTISDFPNESEGWTAPDPKSVAKAAESFCTDCGSSPFNTAHADSLVKTLEIENLVPNKPRGVAPDEWTTMELLGWVSAPSGPRPDSAGFEAMRRFARALLCFIAPFLAWLTLTFTTQRSQVFALPLACAAVMVIDIGFSQIITHLSTSGAVLSLAILLAVTSALLATLIAQIFARQQRLIFPALGRS
jgi:lipopolysaccharide export system permease protein